MKKFIALMLLNIHLLNIGGQLAFHQYLVYKTDKYFTEQTRKGLYNVKDLTEIAVPINMPGIHDWSRFENIAGQIQFNNTSYNYVKMKLTRTAIHLMCIPNYETTKLVNKNVLNAKGVKDIPVPQKDHVPYGKTIMQENISFSFAQVVFYCPVKNLQISAVQPVQPLVHYHLDIPEQPPKTTC
ncbi:hypothetical protein [Mucilaginibacter flavus]|uniref:hypothetical protein n=1 Tax=Mucilaginibacter flavus TaxID=931504 RepID=UPI0025B3AD9B|nr:hypothetical protein [Mucilaginibacter flavus]MDN3580832.1 hypothetical protein [Mucilaginibacter flavus]